MKGLWYEGGSRQGLCEPGVLKDCVSVCPQDAGLESGVGGCHSFKEEKKSNGKYAEELWWG